MKAPKLGHLCFAHTEQQLHCDAFTHRVLAVIFQQEQNMFPAFQLPAKLDADDEELFPNIWKAA